MMLYLSVWSNGFLSFSSWLNDTNVILADEMGLGKTVQSVSMLGFLQVRILFFSSEHSSLLIENLVLFFLASHFS